MGRLGMGRVEMYTAHTLRSIYNAVRGSLKAEREHMQATWEQARMIAFHAQNVHLKRPLKRYGDLLRFPWEKEREKPKMKITTAEQFEKLIGVKR